MRKLLYIFILIFLAGCTTTRIVEVPKIKKEYIVRDSIRHDSIFERDSIFIIQKGDTFYKDRVHYLYKYLRIYKTDTIAKTDSITVVKEIEKKLSMKQKVYMIAGEYTLKVTGIAIVLISCFLILKRTKITRLIKTFFSSKTF